MPSGGGQNTVVQQSGPPPQVLANYQNVYDQAHQVAGFPIPQYDSSQLAGFQPQQLAAFNNIDQAINSSQPFLNQASNYTTQAAELMSPTNFSGEQQQYYDPQLNNWLNTGLHDVNSAQAISAGASAGLNGQNFGSTVANYYNPYAQGVIAPTQALFNQQNATQLNQVRGNAAAQGAFGGDREAVAEAQTAQQQQLAQAPVLANLQSTGYAQAVQNALAAAQQQQQTAGLTSQVGAQTAGMGATQLQGFNAATGALQGDAWLNSQTGFGLGNLANETQSLGLQGSQAQLQAGTLQQQQAQQELGIPYAAFQSAQGYPYQTTGWLGGLASGLGGLSGQQGTSTSPGPSALSQIAGLGLTGVGLLGATGAFGAGGWLTGAGAAGAGLGATDAAAAGLAADATWGTGLADLGAAALVARGGRVAPQEVARGLRGLHVPRRDDGGAVTGTPNPAVMAMFGGNPMSTNLYSMYQRMPTEKLQELIARSPGNPMLARVMKMRQMAPQDDPSTQQQSDIGAPQANGPQSMGAPSGFADGGDVGDNSADALNQRELDLLDRGQSWSGPSPPIAGIGSVTGDNSSDVLNQRELDRLHQGAPPIAGFASPSVGNMSPIAGNAPPPGVPHAIHTPDADIQSRIGGLGSSAHADFMSSPWGTLLTAGLGIMGGTSPFPGVNIGRGGLEGIQVSEQAKLRQAQMDDNALYRAGLLSMRQQQEDTRQGRADTYANSVQNRSDYQNRSLDLKGAIADRAAQLRQQGLDQNQANAQARLEIARGNADVNATYKGARLGQIDQGLDLGAQRFAQSKEAAAARLAMMQQGRDASGANADIAAASRLAASGAAKDFNTALQQVQQGRATQPKPQATPSPQSATQRPQVTPEAIQHLKEHPELAPQFKEHYGVDPAQFLGQ